MAVRVVDRGSGKTAIGKYAVIKEGSVFLYSGCMPDKKGGLRGCGKKSVFPSEAVTVNADDPQREIKSS